MHITINHRVTACIIFLAAAFVLACEKSSEQAPDDNKEPQTTLQVRCTTGEATEIDPTSAKLNGSANVVNATEANGAAYFYYSSTDTDAKGIVRNGLRIHVGSISNSDSAFSTTIKDLTPETKYYYLASVSIDDRDFCGDVKSFITKEKPKELSVTGAASDITEFTAKLSGYANLTPDLGNVTMGIIYSTDEMPTLDNGVELSSRELDGNNMYTVQAKDLQYNTIYYYKSFVQYGGIYRFGEVKTFTTRDFTVEVSTNDAEDVKELSATLKGQLVVDSKTELEKSAWFLFSKASQEFDVETLKTNGRKIPVSLKDDNTFSINTKSTSITLENNVKYYYVACAKVHDKTIYGEITSFTTLDIVADVSAEPTTDITEFKATINGKIKCETLENNLSRSVWFLYSDSVKDLDGLKTVGKKVNASLSDNLFSVQLSNLKPGTKYYFVACARVHNSSFYSDIASFEAFSIDAQVTTVAASGVTEMKATFNGELKTDNREALTKEVWFFYSKGDTSIDELKAKGAKLNATLEADGTFQVEISELQSNTTYSFVACAKVHDRMFLGERQTVQTKAVNASIIISDIANITEFKSTINGKLNVVSTEPLSRSVWVYYSSTYNNPQELIQLGTKASIPVGQTGEFSKTLTNLQYGTKYSFIIVAEVYDKEFSSDVEEIVTHNITASVSTKITTQVTEFKAVLEGELITNNIETVEKKVWFIYSDTKSSLSELKAGGTIASTSLDSNNYFTETLTNLKYGTKYYYVACAKVHDQEVYGEVGEFSTLNINASVTTTTSKNVTEVRATLTGELLAETTEVVDKKVWFFYSSSPDASILSRLRTNGIRVDATLDNETFSYELGELSSDTKYYYVACAKVHDKVVYGTVGMFITRKVIAEVTTKDADVLYRRVTLNGRLSVDSEETLAKSAWFLVSNSASTLETLKTAGTRVEATFNNEYTSGTLVNLKTRSYYYVACAKVHDKEVYGTVQTFEISIPDGAVDLGLSVMWATCNIGAKNPQEYGDYYAWGETKTKASYSESNYMWYDGNTILKYNTNSEYGVADGKTVLERGRDSGETVDDVACAKLGGGWRMPTEAEWTELRENCTCSWTTYSTTGVEGCEVFSNVPGYEGVYIFLPAAGYRVTDRLFGSGGYYLSSSLSTWNPQYASGAIFTASSALRKNNSKRSQGYSVRPVTE